MSWLSKELNRSKLGKVLNKIAKPVQGVVNPVLDKMPVVGSIKAGAEAIGNYIPEVGGAAKPAVQQALGGLPGIGAVGGGGSDAWLKMLAAAQLANAAALGKKSGDFADKAWDTTSQFWGQRAPLREKGIAGMQAAPVQMPQLGAISRGGNPFAPKV